MDSEFSGLLFKFGLAVKNPQLYLTAFTHRSFLNEVKEEIESNERLEFLGDAVLSLIVSTFLFKIRAKDTEGELTHLRSYMVKTDSLAKASKELNLGKFLRMSRGEELTGGRKNPQLLANTYEALLGAIYLDLGLEKAIVFVDQTLLPLFEEEVEKGAPRDPKSQLQEVVQAKKQVSPKYKILAAQGPDHAKRFTVGVFLENEKLGEGTGANKQQAEEEAAKVALSNFLKK